MRLSKLFNIDKYEDIEINSIKTNSKEVNKGDLFVCIKGANTDRHDFLDEAIKNGASACVISKDIESSIPYIKVEDTNKTLTEILPIFYCDPLSKLKVIGITGTDGKTTSAKIVQKMLGENICAYIGTLGISYKGLNEKTSNTTPSLDVLYMYFDRFVKEGIKYLVMETSSEAFFYHRLDGIHFDIAGLTNVTSDHMNTHKTIQNYIDCKKELFINSNLQILNSNDLHFKEFKNISKSSVSYGYDENDLLKINTFKLYPNMTDIEIIYKQKSYNIKSSLLGRFNIENLTLALAICLSLNKNIEDLMKITNKLSIKGRMQVLNYGQNFHCIIDYAHTINSINNVLEFARCLDINKIITVTGQAGGRDQTKRSTIGKLVLEKSDYAIFTSDDPRDEDPKDIINMMLKDTNNTNYEIVLDRAKAIEKAISLAKRNDLILALGKGADLYQKVKDRTEYYSEEESFAKILDK